MNANSFGRAEVILPWVVDTSGSSVRTYTKTYTE